MKRILFFILTVVFIFYIKGYSKPPKLSGNYEQGSRYALAYDEMGFPFPWIEASEQLEEESWSYNFNKGYLRLSQRINKNYRYAVKYNFIEKDFFGSDLNNKNILNYYRTASWIGLNDKMDLKVEYYLRHQNYYIRPWDNITHVPHVLFKFKVNNKINTRASVRYKSQKYKDPDETWKDKDYIVSYLGYNQKITDRLILKGKYNYLFRHYTDNPDQTNAVKKSLSVGFDYQF
ncbi:MAG: hypothetical protein ACOC56_00770 [Atribacterota bacterium]